MTFRVGVALLTVCILASGCGTRSPGEKHQSSGASALVGVPANGGEAVVVEGDGGGDPPPAPGTIYVAAPLPGEQVSAPSVRNAIDPFTGVEAVEVAGTALVKFEYQYFRLGDSTAAGVTGQQLEQMEQNGLINDGTLIIDDGSTYYGYNNPDAGLSGAGARDAAAATQPPPAPPPPPPPPPRAGDVPSIHTISWGELKARYR